MKRRSLWDKNSSFNLSQVDRTLESKNYRKPPPTAVVQESRRTEITIRLPSVSIKNISQSRIHSTQVAPAPTVNPSADHNGKNSPPRGAFFFPMGPSKPKNRSVGRFCRICGQEYGYGSISSHERCCQETLGLRETKELARADSNKKVHVSVKVPVSSPTINSSIHALPQMQSEPPTSVHHYLNRQSKIQCDYCGLITGRGSNIAHHKEWCPRLSKRVRSDPVSKFADDKQMEANTGPLGRVVARVVTLGLTPGYYDQVLIHSSEEKPERPQTRTLSHSSLLGYGLPSLDAKDESFKADSDRKHPNLEQCTTCHKIVASDKLGIHYRLCRGDSTPQASPGIVKIPSTHNLLRVDQKREPHSQSQGHTSHKPLMVVCYICGREYGSKSISIHEPQCLKKFNIQNDQLPINERLPLPRKNKSSAVARVLIREDQQIVVTKLPRGAHEPHENLVQRFYEHCYSEFERELVPCRKCGRTFAPGRHIKHEPNCNAKPLKLL